jgi:hypothetical protein
MRNLTFIAILFLIAIFVIGTIVNFLPKSSNPTGEYTVIGTLTYENVSAVYAGIHVVSVNPNFSPNLVGSFMFLAFNGTIGATFPTGFASGNNVTPTGTISKDEHSQIYVLNVTRIMLENVPYMS